MKISDAKKEGYKKLNFTVTFTRTFKPNAQQVHKIANSGEVGYNFYYSILDYETGQNLEADNDFNVTVKSGDEINGKTSKYKDKDGCMIYFSKIVKVNVTLTCPSDYEGLCILVGGTTQVSESSKDNLFWENKEKFGNTTYYNKKDKTAQHAMRIKKFD